MFITIIAYLLSIAAAAYGLVSWFLQIGPFAFLIRLQDQFFGNYFPMITGIVIVSLCWASPILILRLFVKAKEKKALTEEELRKQLRKPYFLYLLGIFASVALGLQAFNWSENTSETEQITIDLAQPLDRPLIGKNSLWFKEITLTGEPIIEQSYIIETTGKRGSNSLELFVPIKPLEGDQPIQFVCSLSGSNEYDINPEKLSNTGYIVPFVVPVLTRDHFEEQGIKLADHVYIMGDQDLDEKTAAYFALGAAGLLLLILVIKILISPFSNKRKLKELGFNK